MSMSIADEEGDVSDEDDRGPLMVASLTEKSISNEHCEHRDSDFGLSEQQFEELWFKFQTEEVSKRHRFLTEHSLDSDNNNNNHRDSDFGLSDQQLQELINRHAEPVVLSSLPLSSRGPEPSAQLRNELF